MNRQDRAIHWAMVLALAVVTVIAVVISYGHIRALAAANGERGFAGSAGAVTVDGLILTCSLVIVKAARRRSRPPILAWLMLMVGIAATVAANVDRGLDHGWTGAAVAGWPALVATGCFHLVIGEIRRGDDAVEASANPADAEPQSWEPWPLPDLEAAGQGEVGYALWSQMPPALEPVASTGRETVPELEAPDAHEAETALEDGPDPSDDPELVRLVATARDRFAETLADGSLPSVRKLRKEIRVGHPRAVQIRERLAATVPR